MSSHEIELVSLDSVVVAKSNPKAHVVDDLRKSFARFGFVAPLVRDERTGRLLAGHGRLEALVAERDGGGAAPKGITVSEDGEWLVPVVRGVASRDDDEAAAYLLADNQLSIAGSWDMTALDEMLRELADGPGLEGLGFSSADLTKLLGAPEQQRPAVFTSLYEVVVSCSSEREQEQVYERLSREGLKCRVLTL